MMHKIWQKVRRPFIHPKCVKECCWETYDVTMAGCLLCGASHVCKENAFEGNCPLFENYDGTRVCSITGFIIPEIRYGKNEFLDHVVFKHAPDNSMELDLEISKYIDNILDSYMTVKCINAENKIQTNKLYKTLLKVIRVFKLKNPNKMPNMCTLLTEMLHHEKRISFIYPVSPCLKKRCNQSILICILNLKSKGYKISIGNKLQDLVCGLIYLLRTGISYGNHELLTAIPEIARCLPIESKLKLYFNINSKIITSIENEVKLAFRDYHQN